RFDERLQLAPPHAHRRLEAADHERVSLIGPERTRLLDDRPCEGSQVFVHLHSRNDGTTRRTIARSAHEKSGRASHTANADTTPIAAPAPTSAGQCTPTYT